MHRTPTALRTLAVALLTGATLAVPAAGTFAAAAPPAHAEGHGRGGPIWGTIVSRTALNVRDAPTTHSAVVDRLAPGSRDRVECMVRGQSVNGNPYWYWFTGAEGWVSAAFVDTAGRPVPTCADPCPQWKNDTWNNADWSDPDWNAGSDTWAASGTVSFSFSGSWTWTVTGSSG
ncbi:SH3 domain-containing protein [Streptomyces griseorubiginosus]|uniref:SH3 domain-containing protein n=1 Tax=Streptomyces griseorubiginosus TaxID=67304 RepID=UPI00113FF5C7|nr:SH3 domain-containing protein [Streptomyces griseorubiginosus]